MEEVVPELFHLLKLWFHSINESYIPSSLFSVNGVLLTGQEGIGKSFSVRRICSTLEISCLTISMKQCIGQYACYNEWSPDDISNTNKHQPQVIILDDLHILESEMFSDEAELEQGVKHFFLDLQSQQNTFIVGITRDASTLPPLFKKLDLFQRNIQMNLPNKLQRNDILKTSMEPHWNEFSEFEKCSLVEASSGMTPKDIFSALQSANLSNSQRIPSISNFMQTFNTAKKKMTSITTKLNPCTWNSVGGYAEVKKQLLQAVMWPVQREASFQRLGVSPSKGVLLYGPSGCGKTLLVRALSSEPLLHIVSVKGPSLFSKYIGETEHNIRSLFQEARRMSPCVLFLDELDALGAKRDWEMDGTSGVKERALSTLLNEMDGIEENSHVFVIGCTNRPDFVDSALLRPGRLDHLIFVDLPTIEDRYDILSTKLKSMSHSLTPPDIDTLAKKTCRFSGSDLAAFLREAGMSALREDIKNPCLSWRHAESSLKSIKIHFPKMEQDIYSQFQQKCCIK